MTTARHLQLAGAVTLNEYDERGVSYLELEVPVGHQEVAAFTLELLLLIRGLSDRLRLLSPGEATRLEAAPEPRLARSNGVHVLALDVRSMGDLVDFLLVFHRDGAADVSHMHVELASDEADDVEMTLTVDRHKAAGTAEDARRLLLGEDAD